MARAPRIEFAGAIYHVMNRGNQLGSIFRDSRDRMIFLTTLGETCESAGWVVHSLVLMDNHYHLLVETQRPTLVKGMQYLDSTYTKRYNSRHRTHGHLFQGRYKALLVDAEAKGYFLTVSDYIQLNPARVKGARRVQTLKELLDGPWNSAGWLAGSRPNRPAWLRWERVYGELGLRRWGRRSRREYREYLRRRMGELPEAQTGWNSVRRGWCFGSAGFVEEMKGRLREMLTQPRERDSWNDEAVEAMESDLAERCWHQGLHALGYREGDALKTWDRLLLARWVRSRTKVGVKWVAQKAGFQTVGGMASSISLVGKKLPEDSHLQKQWKALETIAL